MTESLNKRLSYLAIADMDYLSARLLLLCGLTHTGLSKAAEAFEKLLKLFLILEAKISDDSSLEGSCLKNIYKHRLCKIWIDVKSKTHKTFDDSWDKYFEQLEKAYKTRYPEGWKIGKFENNIDHLDSVYSYLRKNVSSNFPLEEIIKTKQFGGFIYKAYTPEINDIIKKLGGVLTPKDVFLKNNKKIADFGIDLKNL